MTVFIVQKQIKLDQDTGIVSPRFSTLEKAERFGKLDFLLGPTAHPFFLEETIGVLHQKLKDFSEDDYILPVGNYSLIGVSMAIAAHYSGGSLKLLQWSARDKEYIDIKIRLF